MKDKLVRGRMKVVHSEDLNANFRVVIQKAGSGFDYFMYKDGVLCEPTPAESGITLETAMLYLQGARRAARGSQGEEVRLPRIQIYLRIELLCRIQRLKELPRRVLSRLRTALRVAWRKGGRAFCLRCRS